jgi:hypothetical protein
MARPEGVPFHSSHTVSLTKEDSCLESVFVVCVVLQFHCHDSIPWYIWAAALIGLLSSFSEPVLKLKRD